MKTILIADDEEFTLDLIVRTLEPLGHRVVTASTGQEAMQQAEASHPDLLVLDILMPGGHGFSVCKSLRERPEFDNMKILFLSSKAYSADKHQALQLGGDAFLNKPFDVEELRNTVAALLGEQEGGRT